MIEYKTIDTLRREDYINFRSPIVVSRGRVHQIDQLSGFAAISENEIKGLITFNDKPLARYGIVRIHEDDISVELLEIPYNNMEFLRSYEELEVPEREFILKVFHGGQNQL